MGPVSELQGDPVVYGQFRGSLTASCTRAVQLLANECVSQKAHSSCSQRHRSPVPAMCNPKIWSRDAVQTFKCATELAHSGAQVVMVASLALRGKCKTLPAKCYHQLGLLKGALCVAIATNSHQNHHRVCVWQQ